MIHPLKTLSSSGRLKRFLRSLRRDTSGVALIEFAYSLPILMGVGLYGAETANLAVVTMRVNQVALQVADNGSRIGEASLLSQRRIYESDINDLLLGADIQAGDYIDIYEHGRIIMSSLERNSDGGQWIHWQRCKGKKNHASTYGDEDDGESGTGFSGMGPSGEEIRAANGTAVIFVEVNYDYQPLVSEHFAGTRVVNSRAAFNVRDNRDLSQVYDRSGSDTVSDCDTFTSF